MTTTSVTNKGQITIPVAVREAMHLRAADRVELVGYEFAAVTRSITALKSMFGKAPKTISIERMNAVIAAAGAAAK
ncbi:AbrB/MazE/SpoVT family DNA-binding domain-containing protein [Rhodanobacter sp. B2A1Ga4]|uniref:AbrB/MazE/SpoVT family DNA-binding domain-containing protein n=1 Tax=Rhodanobacter sp. B2A1Ga4 TaxID=2778647 RepID=UPI001B3737A3|nr:AbrB/MazE/SpoVT family DNA-binding domain-containing protein [Rhodanobacter sp. B2A1Ga4]MBQ4854476.1 AbrB/MazE/SpoVT family DNA-binding domain-containing protein [Rhodanobacter sp. B2A1Ga4]